MRFGVFDHIDASGEPCAWQFEERLRLAEAFDRLGFYAYQIAEHDCTPLHAARTTELIGSVIPKFA